MAQIEKADFPELISFQKTTEMIGNVIRAKKLAHFVYTYDFMKIRYLPITCLYSSSTRENFMPLICLSGKWIEKAGFISGDEVSVQVRGYRELVIKLIP